MNDAAHNGADAWRSGKGHRDENFPVASWLIQPRHRGIILSFYNFVRTADDIADHATMPPAWRSTSRRTNMQPPAAAAVLRRGSLAQANG